MSGHLCLKWNNHSKAFVKSISNIQIKERYCDATIICQGRYFPVHRMILSTCSDYFDDMFERINCQHPYVVFKDIEPGEMELLLNYMYQGEVNVVQERLPTLINAAEALKIKGLAVPDDLPTNKESSKKQRSNNSDDNSHSRRRPEDNKRRRNSSNLSDSRDPNLDEHESSKISSDGAIQQSSSNNDEEPQVIKQEPIDVDSYNDDPLRTVFGEAAVPVDESSPSFSSAENAYPSFPTEDGNTILIKNETDNISNLPIKESEYDEQDTTWSDYTSGSALPELPQYEMSNQEDIPHSYGRSQTDTEPNSVSRPKKYYHCPYCTYKSYVKQCVSRHVRFKHTLERPFPCGICHKRFAEKVALERHQRTHTGEKPFQCATCSKRFTQRIGLIKHVALYHR